MKKLWCDPYKGGKVTTYTGEEWHYIENGTVSLHTNDENLVYKWDGTNFLPGNLASLCGTGKWDGVNIEWSDIHNEPYVQYFWDISKLRVSDHKNTVVYQWNNDFTALKGRNGRTTTIQGSVPRKLNLFHENIHSI
jgi:hypothetical protein